MYLIFPNFTDALLMSTWFLFFFIHDYSFLYDMRLWITQIGFDHFQLLHVKYRLGDFPYWLYFDMWVPRTKINHATQKCVANKWAESNLFLVFPFFLFVMHILNRLVLIFITYYVFNRFYNTFIMSEQKQKSVVVVGGGLAGLSAAIEALHHSHDTTKIILIEKEKNIGYCIKIRATRVYIVYTLYINVFFFFL